MRPVALIIVPALLAATPACAADCAKAEDQMTLNICADQSFKAADATLNTLYRQVAQRLKSDTATGKLLVAAQRAWVGFRDAECTFAASGVSGGSIYPMIYGNCAEGLTRKRIADLKAYLACKEGDMSCPVPAP